MTVSTDIAMQGALDVIVSGVGLVVAVVLLVQALRVRRLATGGAIAQRISFVLLATVCLAASALLGWMRLFMPTNFTVAEVAAASRVLVIVAMALLAAYFFGVARAMQSFLDSMTGGQISNASADAADLLDPPTLTTDDSNEGSPRA